MNKIQILDCTLRDGGYINNWEFGFDNIKEIIFNLSSANFDFLECGFLKPDTYNKNKTIFSNLNQLLKLLPNKNFKTKYALMINYGEVDINNINENDSNIFLRVAFKKYQLKDALVFIQQLKEKNYNIFINPMHTDIYSKDELLFLLDCVNEIKPFAFSIVDTIGAMDKDYILELYNVINSNLSNNISLCFHSHNNLGLSYSNTLELIKHNNSRNLVIDCSLMGMGRCAGNLAAEKIVSIFNLYDKEIINKTIDKYIKPIYNTVSRRYKEAYLLSAKYRLHPNYAKYLIDRNFSINKIEKTFNLIPEDKKDDFDINIIEKISSPV